MRVHSIQIKGCVKVKKRSYVIMCEASGESVEEVWESTFRGIKTYKASGPRDVLIIRSSESLEGPDIVPRKKGTLTAEDKDRLTSQGIPGECWGDDVQLIEARCRRDERYNNLLPIKCEDEMSCQSVLGRIKAVMNNTFKPGGIGASDSPIIFTASFTCSHSIPMQF